MKLNDLIKETDFLEKKFPNLDSDLVISVSNLDDIMMMVREYGIDELTVDWYVMLSLARFLAANINDDKLRMKLLQEGKIDKYFGIKLILE